MPSTRAIHASATAMAAARLRTSAPTPTPITANGRLTATPPVRVRHESAADSSKVPPLAAHQAAVTASATAEETSPVTPPTNPYTASLAATTRPRSGKLRNVSVTVPWRYSPATARMPKMSVNRAARATCESAVRCTAGSCTLPPDCTRPVIPATTRRGPAASSSHGPRMVRSLRNSLWIIDDTGASFGGERDLGRAPALGTGGEIAIRRGRVWLVSPAPGSFGRNGQLEECRLQRVGRADLVQWPGETHLARTDHHGVIRRLCGLPQPLACADDGPALVRETTQHAAQPGDPGRVEAIGWFIEEEHPRRPLGRAGTTAAPPPPPRELPPPPDPRLREWPPPPPNSYPPRRCLPAVPAWRPIPRPRV